MRGAEKIKLRSMRVAGEFEAKKKKEALKKAGLGEEEEDSDSSLEDWSIYGILDDPFLHTLAMALPKQRRTSPKFAFTQAQLLDAADELENTYDRWQQLEAKQENN